ncbi:MAG: hypothetical protein PHY11_01025 [Bacilli bacterium]|nr:hypothetical protein [Bacilli bacterium]MDD4065564.1 hypothetical protein [Bacilli bacterium]
MRKSLALIAATLLILTSCGGKSSSSGRIPEDYTGYYRASGITVNIVNGGINVTSSSAILDQNQKIVDIKIDALLIPLQGMQKTSRATRPESIALINDDTAKNYEYVKDASEEHLVNSKKTLGDNHYEESSTTSDTTRAWANQITRLESYLVGKDYSTFMAKVCVTSSSTSYCSNEATGKSNVPAGYLMDFYGYSEITGMSLKLFNSEYDSIGSSLVELFNSNFETSSITKDTTFYSKYTYTAALESDTITVKFTNTFYEGEESSAEDATPVVLETIEDSVVIPLAITKNSIYYTNTYSYIKFGEGKQVLTNIERTTYDADWIISSYQK